MYLRYRRARATLRGAAAMNRLRTGPVQGTSKTDIGGQNEFITHAFGWAA